MHITGDAPVTANVKTDGLAASSACAGLVGLLQSPITLELGLNPRDILLKNVEFPLCFDFPEEGIVVGLYVPQHIRDHSLWWHIQRLGAGGFEIPGGHP